MDRTSEIKECLAAYAANAPADAIVERTAVVHVLNHLRKIAPGKSVEVRIPPYAAVQIVAGVTHRRGTPSAVVEMSARALVQLACGLVQWDAALRDGTVIASGERSNLAGYFPC